MINIDMWYGDNYKDCDKIDITYYPNDEEYRGNIYKDNKCKELPIQTFEIFKDRKLNKHLIERHWDLPDYTVRKERYL